MPWWRMLLPMLENQIIEQLLRKQAFHKVARAVHRRIHKLKTGKSLPPEVDRTGLYEPKRPAIRVYLRYFLEEMKNQTQGKKPRG